MVIGIDPGVKGGMALLTDAGAVTETISFKGFREADVAISFSAWAGICPTGVDCWIEKVGFKKGDGGLGAFTFGKVYGILRGLAMAHGFTIHDVHPMLWQSTLSCLSGGNKNVTKNKAIELFTNYHKARPRGITHGVADALLIAEYGRRMGARGTTSSQTLLGT